MANIVGSGIPSEWWFTSLCQWRDKSTYADGKYLQGFTSFDSTNIPFAYHLQTQELILDCSAVTTKGGISPCHHGSIGHEPAEPAHSNQPLPCEKKGGRRHQGVSPFINMCLKHINMISMYSGWWYTYPSQKNMSSSVGMMTFPIWWEEKKSCSKPPTWLGWSIPKYRSFQFKVAILRG